jgi:cyclopropane fatty-acyl-phospholipid synthase-like methyltransferase
MFLQGKTYTLPPFSLPTRTPQLNSKEIKAIDIGCGPIVREIDGIIPIRVDIREDCNPDYRADVRELPFANESFDIVFSSHVLEHFPRSEWKDVLKEWTRLVNRDGVIKLVLPNIAWAAHRIAIDKVIDEHVLNVLYGQQSYAQDFHYNGLTPERVEEALKELGFTITEPEIRRL